MALGLAVGGGVRLGVVDAVLLSLAVCVAVRLGDAPLVSDAVGLAVRLVLMEGVEEPTRGTQMRTLSMSSVDGDWSSP